MRSSGNASERRAGRKIDSWLIALLFLPALYYLPEVLGPTIFAGIDTCRLNMPFRFFDRQAFASGTLPLWNPYVFAGFPGLAESESGVFYPGSLFIHLPGDFFYWYSISTVIHFVLAGVGFYVWMRQRGEVPIASAFLAATYCTTPFLIFHTTAFGLFTSIAWLPWYLVIFEAGLKGRHPVRTGLWFALFLGFMLMSGSVQAAFLGVLAVILYAIGVIAAQPDASRRKRAFLRCLAVLVPGMIAPLIAAVQLLPTAELSRFSERAAMDTVEFYRIGTWLRPSRLVSLFIFPALSDPGDIQDYGSSLCFLGVVPFALAVASVARWRENGRNLFPLVFGGIVALVLAFGLNLPGYEYLVEIPPLSMFRYPGRSAHVALTFFLALAGPAISFIWSRGAESFKRAQLSWRVGYALGAILAVIAGAVGVTRSGALQWGSAATLVLGIVVLVQVLAWRPKADCPKRSIRLGLGFMLVISLASQIALTYPFSRVLVQQRKPFDESLSFFDDIKAEFPTETEIPRVLLAGSHHLFDPDLLSKLGFKAQEDVWDSMSGNAAGLRGVTALRGLTPLNQNDWKLILRDTLQARIDHVLDGAEAGQCEKTPDDISMRVIRTLGTDVLLLEGDDWRVPGYELWRTDLELPFHDGLCAYRAVDGWVPDAFFVERIYRAPGDGYAPFLKWIGSHDVDVEKEAYLETHEPVGDVVGSGAPGVSRGLVLDRERGFNWMRFDVSVDSGGYGLLVTGENYYPGWRVYIDNEYAREMTREADFLLGAVWVPEGRHTVELRYQPMSVLVGLIVSLGGLALWLILIVVAVWAHRRGKHSAVPSIRESDGSSNLES